VEALDKRIVLTYGTFDLFHIGHLKILQRASELGDELVVAVSTDEFNAVKGKKVMIPYEQRAEIVGNIKCVTKVIPEDNWGQKIEDIKTHNVDVFVMGSDWNGKFDELKEYCEVVYMDRTTNISTTSLKNSLKDILTISPAKLKDALNVIEQLLKELE
tara:strand:- start:3116 stop:3589 length:474 start_codon:yes stop_codon:yes gene_type:complete